MFLLTSKQNDAIINLTKGEKARLSIAISLLNRPKCVIIDMSCIELDNFCKNNLKNYIIKKKRKMIIILTTNNVEDALVLADRLMFIKDN